MTNDNWQTIIAIKDKKPDPLPSNIKEETRNIVEMLLEKDPNNRPDAQTLLSKKEVKLIVEDLLQKI
jgi:hypothetical protein